MKLYIKYMVCIRCKLIVKDELSKLGIKNVIAKSGMVELADDLPETKREQLKKDLLNYGMVLLNDTTSILIEKIKDAIKEMVDNLEELYLVNHEDFLSKKLNMEYKYLSELFSEVKGISVKQYIIICKVERVKEMLLYNELNISDISKTLHFKNVTTLTYQFKKITGLTPVFFKKIRKKRISLINGNGLKT